MDKDVTGLAVERAARTLGRVKELFNKRVPYGPNRVSMTSTEARKLLGAMSETGRLSMRRSMGDDAWNKLLESLYNGR